MSSVVVGTGSKVEPRRLASHVGETDREALAVTHRVEKGRAPVKVKTVAVNNRKALVELTTRSGKSYPLPFCRLDPAPTREDPIKDIYVDRELDHEGATYRLESGAEGAVMLDQALDYNRDPEHIARMLLHNLTVKALEQVESSGLSRRELARRLGTSLSQLYRLLDPTNYKKNVGQMVELLFVLGLDVDIVVKPRDAA